MGSPRVIDLEGLDRLVAVLRERGFRVIGPTVREGAIVQRELRSAAELPAGWTDVQEPGRYRLERREDEARFAYAVGPDSAKSELFPAVVSLWKARRREDGSFDVAEPEEDSRPTALLGVKPCELAAIAVQDRVLSRGRYADKDYAARRARTSFVVAANCTTPASTCFCASRGTGPGADSGFDLALTELLDGGHRFVVETGTDAGADMLAELPSSEAAPEDLAAARALVERAAASMQDGMEPAATRELLLRNLESPHWQEVADRCLTCGNCTLACPTCFCTQVEDVNDLTGETAERRRLWDTCFSVQYAEVHGGNNRPSPAARYRQWLTHKLATWQDQFELSGCVGCGRCITWCPVGIDIRAEVAGIRASEEGNDADA